MAHEAAIAYGPGRYQRIDLIRKGLPLNSLQFFLKQSGLSQLELAQVLQVSARTLQRYQPGQQLSPALTEKLLALNDIYQLAATALGGDAQNTTTWLRQKNQALGGLCPLSLLDTYQGVQEVKNVLGRLEWGVYS